MTIDATTASTAEALDMLEDISARARAMDLGLVAYPVEDVEAVCAALRAVRGKSRAAIADTKLEGGLPWSTKPTATTKPNWARCPSTHCERRQECASPHECSASKQTS